MLVFKHTGIPWGIYQGIARTAISLGLALTLILTPADILFTELESLGSQCRGYDSILFFCITEGYIDRQFAAKLLGFFLLIIATGLFPALTAIPLFYSSISIYSSITIPDGGDQIAQIITFLLVPVSLFDLRVWSFSRRRIKWTDRLELERYTSFLARVFLYLIKIQVSIVYFWAGVSKLNEPAWREGTAIYYWMSDPTFGASEPLSYIVLPIVSIPVVALTITWGTILLEVLLGISCFMPNKTRIVLLPIGIIFHILIFVILGISSFGIIMIGAILLLLVPLNYDLNVRSRNEEIYL